MSIHRAAEEPHGTSADPVPGCPEWCVSDHGVLSGEEDWVHLSGPVAMVEGLVARTCLSIDLDTGVQDGPYVLVGGSELTVDEARALGETLIQLAGLGDRTAT